MNRGMMISCAGCGFLRHVDLNGDFDAREAELNAVLTEGWRYSPTFDGYLCQSCRTNGPKDKLFMAMIRRIVLYDKLGSYVELRDLAERQVAEFEMMEGWTRERETRT